MTDECCGTCANHQKQGADWVCTSPMSDMYADYTDYEYVCDKYEERGSKP